MERTGRIIALVSGALSFIFGVMLTVAMLTTDTSFDTPAYFYALLIIGVLLMLCGVSGITGGILIGRRNRAARVLLLIAAIAGLPSSLIFFVLMMNARKHTVPDADLFPE